MKSHPCSGFCRNAATLYPMKPVTTTLKTLNVRIRDKHAPVLRQWAFECNQVWNFANAYTTEYSNIAIPSVGWVRSNITAFDKAQCATQNGG
ncbi:MAG: hypothetical protein QJT81_14000 [Candidatus Thiothrix putei]|uniref:Transposase n=1 Tax=Candidatus Thiothrix putei TaxID=3080811 RepID=A0AA95HBC4_9GAMM|nr:MAG: hypothetical protein QJT81_14000 [Candidatus Thiothrix putei]